MQIRKYYKDFDKDKELEENGKIPVHRLLFYISEEVIVFLDLKDKDTKEEIISRFNKGKDIKMHDTDKDSELYVPRNQIKMMEVHEVELTEEDFTEE